MKLGRLREKTKRKEPLRENPGPASSFSYIMCDMAQDSGTKCYTFLLISRHEVCT
jgi:hypothetical protein